MYFIALDIGATFIKAACFRSGQPKLKKIIRVPFPAFESQASRRREIDADSVVQAAAQVLDQALSYQPQTQVLLVSGQMHGLVLADEAGKPLSPFISWQDQRCLENVDSQGSYYRRVQENLSPYSAELGHELRPGFPVTNLFWLKQKKLVSRRVYALSLPDFVIARLAKVEPTCSPMHASAFGLYSLKSGGWHREAIHSLDLQNVQWPRIQAPSVPVGEIHRPAGRLTVYPAVGDQQAALAGAFLNLEELSLNIATGSQVSLLTRDFEPGSVQVRPYFDDLFLNTITHIPAGRAINTLLKGSAMTTGNKTAQLDELWKRALKELEYVRETSLAVNLNVFEGAYAPEGISGEGGYIRNIREDNFSLGHILCACLRAMAQNYAQAANCLVNSSGNHGKEALSHLVFSGGLALKIPRLRDEIVEATRRIRKEDARETVPAVRISPHREDALMGLCVFGNWICDQSSSWQEVSIRLHKKLNTSALTEKGK